MPPVPSCLLLLGTSGISELTLHQLYCGDELAEEMKE